MPKAPDNKLFKDVPVEDETRLFLMETENHEGYDVRVEGWEAEGFVGRSLVFKAEAVDQLDDVALRDLCRRHPSCPKDEKDDGFTISRDRRDYTFVNFAMEIDPLE